MPFPPRENSDKSASDSRPEVRGQERVGCHPSLWVFRLAVSDRCAVPEDVSPGYFPFA